LNFVELNHLPQKENEDLTEISSFSEEEILQMLKELPTGYRTIFNLYVLDGLTHQEIASHLKISPQTSKSQLHKAKKMLRTKIEQSKKNTDQILSTHGG